MRTLRLALLADGTSDRALLPVLRWSLRALNNDLRFYEPDFVARDLSVRLEEAMQRVIAAHRPDVLFIHRDAEKCSLKERRDEIPDIGAALVRVVPVRMTEAWLLIDERAIRAAAGNPNGSATLDIPPVARLESLPNPKSIVRNLLVTASDFTSGRRRDKFKRDLSYRVQRVAEYIESFEPLRALPAFKALELDIVAALETATATSGASQGQPI